MDNRKIIQKFLDVFFFCYPGPLYCGEVLCRNSKSGEEYDMYYCDVYGLQNGKIKNMVTYSVNKKKK